MSLLLLFGGAGVVVAESPSTNYIDLTASAVTTLELDASSEPILDLTASDDD